MGVALLVASTATVVRAEEAPKEEEPVVREALIEQTSRGEAVAETAAPGWHYPKAYASRPLTMNKYMIRATMLIDIKRAAFDRSTGTQDSRPLVSLDFGAAFSVFDNLEVGVSNYRLASSTPTTGQALFPVIVSPRGGFGDMPLYVRYSFLKKDYVEMGADFVLSVPSWTNLAVTFGLPTRIRVRDVVTIDTGTELTILSNGAGLNIEVPLKATYNIRPAGFIFADSGFSFQNLARRITGGSYDDSNLAFPLTRNQVFMPLGAGGGYTHVFKDIVMLDIFARFGWNPFFYVNPPSGVSAIPAADSWLLTVGVVLHTSPVLHEGDLE